MAKTRMFLSRSTNGLPNFFSLKRTIKTSSANEQEISPKSVSNPNHDDQGNTKSLLPLTRNTIAYPWLMSTQPPRKSPPSFFEALKDRHILNAGFQRIQKHLQEPAYMFPEDFYKDTSKVIRNLFKTLSDSDRNTDLSALQPLMLRGLLDYIIPANQDIKERGGKIEFSIRGKDSLDFISKSIRIKSINFTYGPYPAPPGYIAQAWYSLMTLVIPESDSVFRSYQKQKEITDKAMEEGVFIRLDCTVKVPLLFTVYNDAGAPIIRDSRNEFDVQFISPHFSPYDEIFTPKEDGSWQLAWQWRISDIDYLVTSNATQADLLLSPRKPQIDWFGREGQAHKFFDKAETFDHKYLSVGSPTPEQFNVPSGSAETEESKKN